MASDYSANIRIGIIGGTGLGEVLLAQMEPSNTQTHQLTTPFGEPSSAIVTGRFGDVDIAFLQRHGDGHVLNPSAVPYRANIFALKQLGCTHILASGATGSLREDIAPGDVVICDQLIDRTVARPRTFYERAAVHVEFADPMCPVMRQWLLTVARERGAVIPLPLREGDRGWVRSEEQDSTTTHPPAPSLKGRGSMTVHHRGTYICIEGPSFSTRAESLMHRQWGGWGADVVGMTALPEARLAREAEVAYALIALPTDYDCWRTSNQPQMNADERGLEEVDSPSLSGRGRGGGSSAADERTDQPNADSLLEEIIANLNRATAASIALIRHALADVSILHETPSPAHRALDLAIWSDKSKNDPAEVERLRPLWGRHFE